MRRNELPIAEILTRHLLFSRLNQQQLDRVSRNAVRVRVGEQEILFEKGTPASRFYLVCSGQIKLFRVSPGGAEKIIEIVMPGHSFAEALMFLDNPVFPVSASALQAATLISIDSRDFKNILEESMGTCFLIMGEMSQRLRGLVQEIDDLTLQSATCRVAGYLLNNAQVTENALVLDLPKQVLASRLSVTPETFSRILRKLSEKGFIEVDRGLVLIRNRSALAVAADQCLT